MSDRKLSGIKIGPSFRPPKVQIPSDTNKISVAKGHDSYSVDLTDFRNRIGRLYKNHSLEVKNISGTIKQDYEILVEHVKNLKDTDAYQKLFEEVKKLFGQLDTAKIKKGTIGSYCAGCILAKDKSCPIVCEDSMPLPKENGWQFCSHRILWLKFENGKYIFSELNSAKTDAAVIYVQHPQVYGFTYDEKAKLRSMGLLKAQIIHAPLSNGEFREIIPEFTEIDKLPNRDGGQPVAPVPKSPPKAVLPVSAAQPVGVSVLPNAAPSGTQKAVSPQPVPVAVSPVVQLASPRKDVTGQPATNTTLWIFILILLLILVVAIAVHMYYV